MGERGLISRLLAGKFGGYLTFGRLQGGLGSAPGQPLLSELQGMYRVHSQQSSTKVCSALSQQRASVKRSAAECSDASLVAVDSVFML